jgi:hypothetical protein
MEKLAAEFERLLGAIGRRRGPASKRGARRAAERTAERI